ncbi:MULTISPECIES: hypothetical protein [Ralstonia]|uniref:hypothetical protein n=1 Tax=Ralstonia TaxID=48736 RepID=UPI00164A4938|nr:MULTISPECIES: hypothetical protein [unclassified Ralstonia]
MAACNLARQAWQRDIQMHAVLDIKDHAWQSLYHFTVGCAMIDQRLSTLAPYEVQA